MANVDAILKGVETGIRVLFPAIRDLIAQRKELKDIIAAGGDVTNEQWAARDAEWDATADRLEALLRAEVPPEGGDPPPA